MKQQSKYSHRQAASTYLNRVDWHKKQRICDEFELTTQQLINLIVPNPRKERDPRPANSWIIWRKIFCLTCKIHGSLIGTISRLAKQKWDDLEHKKKEYCQTIADWAKDVHLGVYPDYKYRPRQNSIVNYSQVYPGQKIRRRKKKIKRRARDAVANNNTPPVSDHEQIANHSVTVKQPENGLSYPAWFNQQLIQKGQLDNAAKSYFASQSIV
jgi:hypothetical protein